MSTFLSQAKGFTPVIDVVVEDVGLMTAVVYGKIWRYCQMKNHVCQAPMRKIADEIGVSTRTARRHAKKLVDAGYLKDLTPDLRNKPHTYADTGKVVIQGLLEVKDGMTESHTGVTESHTEVGQRVTPRCDRESNEDSLLRESLRKDLRESSSATPKSAGPTPQNLTQWFDFIKNGDGRGGEPARLGEMFEALYPDYEPNYGHIGKAMKRVGGARRLAHLCWHSQVYRVTGDPVAYCQALHQGKTGPRSERDEQREEVPAPPPGEPKFISKEEE